MQRRLALKNWTLLVASATLLWGCASGPKPTPVDLQLTGAATVNPDSRNRPSPVMVRVYELKTPAAFESADFFSLFDKDRETLAADMNTRDEFVLQPGQTVSLKRDAKMDTRYIGVLVAYRDLERSRWRAVTALPSINGLISRTRARCSGTICASPVISRAVLRLAASKVASA